MLDDRHEDDRTQSYSPIPKGTVISRYRIVQVIGVGGMGEVYLAEDTDLNRKVALKFMLPHCVSDPESRMRFEREEQIVAKLKHPNIVTVYEIGEFKNRPFFAMEYCEGESLKDVMEVKELPLDRIIDLVIQICEGLSKAHAADIHHRDIKPSNILFDADGRVKILDFGLADMVGREKLTQAGSTLGTIGYMSPEQIRCDRCDARTDLFSLGVVLYELVTRQMPFQGDRDVAVMNSVLHETPEPLARYKSGVTGELQRVVSKLLEKDPELRYQSAAGVISDLNVRRQTKWTFESWKLRDTFHPRKVLSIGFSPLLHG